MSSPVNPVLFAAPVFFLLIAVEVMMARAGRLHATYETQDTKVSFIMGLGSTIVGALGAGFVAAGTLFVYEHRLFSIPTTAVWAWVLLLFGEDLCYYWLHRLSHERRFWWASHVNHHSSQHFNLGTALRQTWTGDVAGRWVAWLPLSLIGFPPHMVAIQKGISLIAQFWVHTESIGKLHPWIEAVFNTPSHHRVHHATNDRYLDRNYGAIFIVWDRIFGTFQAEVATDPPRYGLVKNLGTFNIWISVFHEWFDLLADVRRARSLQELVGYVFGPPGWTPGHGLSQASEARRRRVMAAEGVVADISAITAPGGRQSCSLM